MVCWKAVKQLVSLSPCLIVLPTPLLSRHFHSALRRVYESAGSLPAGAPKLRHGDDHHDTESISIIVVIMAKEKSLIEYGLVLEGEESLLPKPLVHENNSNKITPDRPSIARIEQSVLTQH